MRSLRISWLMWAMAVLVVAGSILLSGWVSTFAPFQVLENKAYDLDFLLRKRVPKAIAEPRPPAAVTIVWIDSKTDDYLSKPRMLWPGDFGDVLRAASAGGAKVIGLDYYFSYPVTKWDEAADPLFFQGYLEATQHGVPVILAYERAEDERASEKLVPVYLQAVADNNIGYAELVADPDSFVRKLEWKTLPGPVAFATRIVQSFMGDAILNRIPEVEPRKLAINYYGPRGTFPGVSMRKVLEAFRAHDQASLDRWFKGRVVLIGPDDLPDRHATPFYLQKTANGEELMEGTEIHAHIISTILQGDFLRPASAKRKFAFLLLMAVLATLAGFAVRWPLSMIALVALVAGAFAATVIAHDRGLILPVVAPELAIILATLGSYGGRLLTQDRHRAVLEKTFGDMVSPEVMKSVLDAGKVPSEGQRCELTVLFSDIRGFTKYSEHRDPEDVVRELNEYLSLMTKCVMDNGGMVNKYIGDGIMALFGAPVAYEDHARRAVICAQQMMTSLEIFNAKREAAGLDPWKIGVGIHTGEVVVGFVGARDKKMEYTANGDTVNVASRLESMNKTLSTTILLSLATRDHMGMDIATIWKGSHRITGREEEEGVYTV